MEKCIFPWRACLALTISIFLAFTSSFITPVRAQQLVLYYELEDEDDIQELKEMVSEFNKLSKDELKELDLPFDSINLKKAGDYYALSISLLKSIKTINHHITGGFPEGVVRITIPEGIERIEDEAFYDSSYSHLTSITIPNSITYIGENAFERSKGLNGDDIPELQVQLPKSLVQLDGRYVSETIMKEYVAKTSEFIVYCDLSYVEETGDIEDFVKEFERVANSSEMPKNANTYSVSIEREDKNLVAKFSVNPTWNGYYSDGVFAPEENDEFNEIEDSLKKSYFLSVVEFDELKKSLFVNSEYWRMFRESIVKIAFLEGVEFVEGSRDNLMNLREVELPNTLIAIGGYAFEGYNELKNITIPNSVRFIGNSAFRYCDNLTSITIPNSVKQIGDGAFYGCKKLTSITIPSSVVSLGSEVFYGCDNLSSITLPKTLTDIGYNAFPRDANIIRR